MKKTIIALALVLAAGFSMTSTSAFAWGNGYGHGGGHGYGHSGGHGYGHGGGHGYGHRMGGCTGGFYNNAAYNNADYQAFMKETADLRSEIAADRAELSALMRSDNPNTERVRELTRSISDKENTLADMARDQNIAFNGHGYGNGWNCGITGHNHGFGNCW